MKSSLRSARRGFHGAICGSYKIPDVVNEPLLDYAPGSVERANVEASIKRMESEKWEIPCVVNGVEYKGTEMSREIPHQNKTELCKFHYASKDVILKAVDAALDAQKEWSMMPFQHRAAIWLKAADLIATKYRADILASTMLGQSKTIWQAEIDASVESIDFLRYDVKYAEQIYAQQPVSDRFTWNFSDHRPLEGFVTAISPFNFTAIGLHLPTAPALMGNTVVWKCSDAAIHSNYLILKILKEAGLPDGVINFVPADPSLYNAFVIPHRDLAGVAFTGSTATFSDIWEQVGRHINTYRGYPTLVGECGGKNFHLVHDSADIESVRCGTIRGAFEYQGQKCSATSRMYISKSKWSELKEPLAQACKDLYMGNVHKDLKTFMGAVIDERAYRKVTSYIEAAKNDPACTIVAGGGYSDKEGWFVEPTIIETTDPKCKTMREEIFGPVLTVFAYDDKDFDAMPALIDETTPYSLTGSLFCNDRAVINKVQDQLYHSVGNFYINDKSTGSIVGQQPFGGSRSSGTNDKAGSAAFLSRWTSPRSTKETMVPLRGITYPSMA
eukprot:TRINITY_DN496_c9_g1_i1.p1 TRINITY_DN496_c9_g1~~TRINITY_DN496_c9_g1_i1.p1  ORF type:complete len:576 (+),score=124.24 TRINITY_DN496_c9_g1_i1:62-1729(+)